MLAVKVLDLRATKPAANRQAVRAWAQEVEMLHRVAGHSNVIRIAQTFKEEGVAYIVMERGCFSFIQWIDLMPKLTVYTLRDVFRQMLCGLAAVHAARVVHRDVKPENFLALQDGTIKLIDFGFAEAGASFRGRYGTAPFMAPEMLVGSFYGAEVDVWSLGVIVYALFYGRLPYAGSTNAGMKDAIRIGSPAPDFVTSTRVPAEAADFVRSLLERSADERPSAEAASACTYLHGQSSLREAETLRPMLQAAKRTGAFGRCLGHRESTCLHGQSAKETESDPCAGRHSEEVSTVDGTTDSGSGSGQASSGGSAAPAVEQ